MKKFYRVCVAVLFCALFLVTGCAFGGSKPKKSDAIDFLKTNREFKQGKYEKDYTVNFVVEEDLSYSLSISHDKEKWLKDYSVTGTSMEYVGSYKKTASTESWGITTHYTTCYFVFKLVGATVLWKDAAGNESERNFYLIMDTFTDPVDFSVSTLVAHPIPENGEKEDAKDISGYPELKITPKNSN